MEITFNSGAKKSIKYLICFLCPTRIGDARLSRDGKNFEEATEDTMPGSIYGEFLNIDTSKEMFKKRFLDGRLVHLVIDIDNGTIKNWPEGLDAEICWKVNDQGLYMYLDKDEDIFCEFDGNVPDELAVDDEGFGKYVVMTINNGKIHNWDNAKEYIPDTIKDHFMWF